MRAKTVFLIHSPLLGTWSIILVEGKEERRKEREKERGGRERGRREKGGRG